MRLRDATPDQLRAYGDELAKSPDWGPNPPAWHVAMAQMDWYVEAMLVEQESRSYEAFLEERAQRSTYSGFDPVYMPDSAFDFQEHLIDWSVRKGRAAIFSDCGTGKTLMELAWGQNVVQKTNKPVLLLTPLAVAAQTVQESNKFGIQACRSKNGEMPASAQIVVANYERLHYFEPDWFGGVICDESSAIKNFSGKRREEVTRFMRKMPYRLLATATAAPNDYTELGTSSEAVGELGYMDMLARFFRNTQGTADTGRVFGKAAQWRFKGHAEQHFWKWVCSWARAMRFPSDLGFDDDGFQLPPLVEREHVVITKKAREGMLFSLPARDMREEREERRRTLGERCDMAAQLCDHNHSSVIWCHLNDEGDRLERSIPGARQIAGSTPDDKKEELFAAFGSGQLSKLVIKPKIGAWGLNWQHCNHVVTFASHSYEQYYQAVRRCWRFGQKNPVTVDLVVTEGELWIKDNLRRKAAAADKMFASLVSHMSDALRIDRDASFNKKVEVPSWL